jgi:hypothetical protein
MMAFELNQETLRKGWGGVDQYWFSLKNYKICDASSLAQIDVPELFSHSAYFLSLGYIPYFVISNEEVIRAYIDSIKNEKLKAAFNKVDKQNFVETFWKYFNVYPILSEGWQEFEDAYVLRKAEIWCKENGINYVVKSHSELTA